MAPKRNCSFNQDLQKEYPFIKKSTSDFTVRCNICSSGFTINHSGRGDIKSHINSDKHKRAVATAASSSSLTHFFRAEQVGDKEEQLAATEGAFAYHTVMHNHTFRSMDCTSKLLQVTLEPKFACARTKTEAIIRNVLTPHAQNELRCDLENVTFISILTDASNHKEIKIFPLLVRYFDRNKGLKVKILELKSLPGETSDIVSSFLIDCLTENGLELKVVGLCADNTNSNFGGAERKGQNNVFTKLKENLGHSLIGVGCACHIFHNTVRAAADVLPVDVEMTIAKIYLYFKSYTVRVESLKEFCQFVDTDFQMILGYAQTRWLALLPAVERVLYMFLPLKSYFQSQDRCPVFIQEFFENPLSEAWLILVHSQASSFHEAVQKVEGQMVTVFEVIDNINRLKAILESKLEDGFLPSRVQIILKKLEMEGFPRDDVKQFNASVSLFYETALSYLKKWAANNFQNLESYSWVMLNRTPNWEDIEKSSSLVSQTVPSVDFPENEMYDEYVYMKQFVTSQKISEWSLNKTLPGQRWVELASHFKNNHVPVSHILKLAEFFLCLPGTNAATERVFSLMNSLWTNDKTHLGVETLKAMLITKVNYEETCVEFYKMLHIKKDILQKIHSSEKYSISVSPSI